MTEQREVTVSGALVRHQLRQYLRASGLRFNEVRGLGESTFYVPTATPEQWRGINEWLERTKVTG